MRGRIDGAIAELEDPSVFTAFSAVIAPVVAGVAPGAGAWGRIDGEHAWVRRDWLRAQAPTAPAERDAWLAQLDGMLAFAASRGWVSGDEVHAHLELPGD